MTRLHAILTAASLLCAPLAHAQTSTEPVDVTLLAINDFHGNLRPAPGGIVIDDPFRKRPDRRRRAGKLAAHRSGEAVDGIIGIVGLVRGYEHVHQRLGNRDEADA